MMWNLWVKSCPIAAAQFLLEYGLRQPLDSFPALSLHLKQKYEYEIGFNCIASLSTLVRHTTYLSPVSQNQSLRKIRCWVQWRPFKLAQ